MYTLEELPPELLALGNSLVSCPGQLTHVAPTTPRKPRTLTSRTDPTGSADDTGSNHMQPRVKWQTAHSAASLCYSYHLRPPDLICHISILTPYSAEPPYPCQLLHYKRTPIRTCLKGLQWPPSCSFMYVLSYEELCKAATTPAAFLAAPPPAFYLLLECLLLLLLRPLLPQP